jgi:bis(5'-nucleosyl)-tetraphosphatase (symmetrical)
MRYCTPSGDLEFKTKTAPNKNTESNLIPWYEFQKDRFADTKWIFGHWASLMGHTDNKNILALDTGYVWGNYFSVLKLKTRELTYIQNTE